jgi:protein-arginine kinase
MFWNLHNFIRQLDSRESKETIEKIIDNEKARKTAEYEKLIEIMDNNPEMIKKILAVYIVSGNYGVESNITALLINNNVDVKKQI